MSRIPKDPKSQPTGKRADRESTSATAAVALTPDNEQRRIEHEPMLLEQLRPLMDGVAARPATGLEANKAFYDDLAGDP